eukprot:TRINITY_DN14287_c0_g3_i1.p1 TRINITY_DN14287_c0_g3~~TRINITY_DN14287_c0_g3_i1.p1  ORF type:complete len:344 (-),score=9.31 TRINITY_DN14287_c0_g3_i1:46-1077(-)
MASYNPGDSLSQKTPIPHKATTPSSAIASSPDVPPTTKSAGQIEAPKEPAQIYHAFERPIPDPLAIGNPSLELALKLKGNLGYFINRDKVDIEPVFINLNTLAYRDGVLFTLRVVTERLLRLQGHIENAEIIETATNLATQFANGIMIMTYIRLRRVNSLEATQLAKFCKRPKVPDTLEVPAPYALAISQLGIVEASSMERIKRFVPTLTNEDRNYCLPAGIIWSTARYLQAVEYGKKIGISFKAIDLSVPLGSSWWLYRQDNTDDLFSLQCTLPEDNYTEATAILHTLFCSNGQGGLLNEIFDLSPIENHNYGAILRNPHVDINVSSYFAIEEAPDTVWKVV